MDTEYEEGRVRYVEIDGDTLEKIRMNAQASALHKEGDMILVAVNEGDILQFGKLCQ